MKRHFKQERKIIQKKCKEKKNFLLKGSVSPVLNLSKILDALFVYTFHS